MTLIRISPRARSILSDAGFMVAAFGMNVFFLFPLFGELTLHFGQALGLLAFLLFGFRSALLTSLAAGLGLWWTSGAWSLPLLFMLETSAIGMLVLRGLPLVPASVVFWIVVGLPLNYLMATTWLHLPSDVLHISVIKQAINGVLNAALAAGLFQLLVNTITDSTREPRQNTSLLHQTFAMSVTLVLLPALIISLFLVNQTVETLGDEVEYRLKQQAQDYALLTELHLDRHQTAIRILVDANQQGPGQALNDALDRVAQAHPGLLTMVVADSAGQIVHGTPREFYERLAGAPVPERSVADRDWFRIPRGTGLDYLSDGFVGRGFGTDPIVAISSPLLDPNGMFLGVVEGSLSLPRFADLTVWQEDDFMLVTDRAGRRVYAPDALGIPALEPVGLLPASGRRLVDVDQVELAGERYFVAEARTQQGWTVYALTHTRVLAGPVERFMVALGFCLLGLIALGGWVARVFAHGVTRPLATLSAQILDPELKRIQLPGDQRQSPEIVQVMDALDQARQLSMRFRYQLQTEVAAKTSELRSLNRKLEALAIGDSLTGLLNRRGFQLKAGTLVDVVRRESLGVVLAMIDIDHFKVINDEHGHPAGDACLRHVAQRLQANFRRRDDLVARFGGEEFVVLAVSKSPESQFPRLERFREEIEEMRVDHDGLSIRLTVSIGAVASMLDSSSELDDLLEQADRRLYASKRGGRNRLVDRSVESPPD